MLKDVLTKRYTAKWWNDQPVEQEKIEDILKCAYLAPSKNGKHNHKIYVITDSPEGKAFKDFLYYENAWCLGEKRAPAGYVGNDRRFNGQVHAPIVLLWVGESKNIHSPTPHGESDKSRIRDDCLVSATIAMCAAEELGLNTGFNGMIGPVEISDRLGLPRDSTCPMMVIGIGYSSIGAKNNRPVLEVDHRAIQHPNTLDKKFPNAYNSLLNNVLFLQNEVAAWVFQHSTTANFSIAKCRRDVKYVLDAFLQDLQMGTTTATKTVVSNYWFNKKLQVQQRYESELYQMVKDLIITNIFKKIPYTAKQHTVLQYTASVDVEDESLELMISIMDTFIAGLAGEGLIPQIGFDLNNVDPSDRFPQNRKNRPPAAEMIKYI